LGFLGLWTGTPSVCLSIYPILSYLSYLILSYIILSYLYVCLSIFFCICVECIYIYIGIYSMAEFYQPFLRRHRIFFSVVQDGLCLDHPWIVSILMLLGQIIVSTCLNCYRPMFHLQPEGKEVKVMDQVTSSNSRPFRHVLEIVGNCDSSLGLVPHTSACNRWGSLPGYID